MRFDKSDLGLSFAEHERCQQQGFNSKLGGEVVQNAPLRATAQPLPKRQDGRADPKEIMSITRPRAGCRTGSMGGAP